MRIIKTFEDYHGSDSTLSIYLDEANKYINNPLIEKTIASIPGYLKSKIRRFFESGQTIDIDKMVKINEKYNIFSKVKKLYDSGVRSIEDIYKRISNYISPKNESFFGTEFLWVFIIIFIITSCYITIKYFVDAKNLVFDHSIGDLTGVFVPVLLMLAMAANLYFFGVKDIVKQENDYYKISDILKKENIEIVSYPGTMKIDNKTTKIITLEKDGVKKIVEYKNLEFYMNSDSVRSIFD